MSLPDSLELLEYNALKHNRMEYCWLSWKHKDEPFSKRTLDYIASIDIMQDIKKLDTSLKIRPICLRNMRISCTLLKKGAAAGLNLGEIGKIWCRTDDEGEIPSILEILVERAQLQAEIIQEIRNFRPTAITLDFDSGKHHKKSK